MVLKSKEMGFHMKVKLKQQSYKKIYIGLYNLIHDDKNVCKDSIGLCKNDGELISIGSILSFGNNNYSIDRKTFNIKEVRKVYNNTVFLF